MKKIIIAAIGAAVITTVVVFGLFIASKKGITWAGFNRATSYGDRKIIIYSGGQIVKEYTSKGAVISEENSDGCYFTDRATGKLIEVSADYLIEEL